VEEGCEVLSEVAGGVEEGEAVETCEEEGGEQEVESRETVFSGESLEEAGEPRVKVGVEVGELVKGADSVGVVMTMAVAVRVIVWVYSMSELVVGEKDRDREKCKKEGLLEGCEF
jgi:hypothetical protein